MSKVQFNRSAQFLGYSNGTPYSAYTLDYHNLIHSVSNPRNRKTGSYSAGSSFLVHHFNTMVKPITLPSYVYGGNQWGGDAAPIGTDFAERSLPTPSGLDAETDILLPYGTAGWRRARPGNPVANAGQFLIELHQLPTIPGLGKVRENLLRGGLAGLPGRMIRRLTTFRKLGSEYLNIQFGWAPFVRDLQKMHQLTLDIDHRLDQLRRDNGRSLYRRRVLKDTTLVSSLATASVNGPFGYMAPVPIITGGGFTTYDVTQVYTERVWFVGRFQYYVPNIGTQAWTKRATRALYGGDLTPSLVWEVLPWSWLIDWFSNVGDVMSNMSANAVDNTIAKYAYVMRTEDISVTSTVHTRWGAGPAVLGSYPAGSGTSVWQTHQTRKSRIPATPFGFGVSLGTLSGYQLGILAALGMSRSRF